MLFLRFCQAVHIERVHTPISLRNFYKAMKLHNLNVFRTMWLCLEEFETMIDPT